MKEFDVIICGGGPAGLTAAIYAQRGGLSSVVIEKTFAGGQMTQTYEIENYTGFAKIGGVDLSMSFLQHAEGLGTTVVYEGVEKIDTENKIVETSAGNKFKGKAIILAFGASHRHIGIDSEEQFRGMGVSYCATCDGAFYKNKTVVVMGGGNTALEDALYLTKFAKKVYLVHRRDEFRAVGVLVDNVKKSSIEIVYDSVIDEILGDKNVKAVNLRNTKTNTITKVETDGVFVAIGQIPESAKVGDEIAKTPQGYILADEKMRTNVERIYVAGDVRDKELRQVITACADGAIAADSAIKDLF